MEAAEALTPLQQDELITLTVQRERGRLLGFIRASVADAAEAEDILQETLYELLLAYRMLQPVEQVGAWLARVARNRIIDRLRRSQKRGRSEPHSGPRAHSGDPDGAPARLDEGLEELLAVDGDPPSAAMRARLFAEVEAALEEVPPEQRAVFLAHELEGLSFKELAARSGVGVNTLLSRKHAAVRFLRGRLQAVWDDWLMT
jgi:RNA polymerase sigma factor (sigma-70 family)